MVDLYYQLEIEKQEGITQGMENLYSVPGTVNVEKDLGYEN